MRAKWIVGALMIAFLVFTLVLLQRRYDESDLRKSVELLMAKPPGAHWSVADELNQRSGSAPPTCQPRLVSSFAGTLEVRCNTGGESTYRFSVDLVRKAIQPLDEPTRALMQQVVIRNHSLSDAGTPADADAGR